MTPCYWPGSATSLPPWAKGRRQALFELGHLTMKFDGGLNAFHPGVVHLSGPLPALASLHGELVIAEGRP
ncbi:PTS system glucitol/sorbitol-specific transporter subunit IIA [Klebsiella michiganensis]|nr:PTS system glucitol/sorbitol-specific transporter subunit IIA [Klebsiella michiganensis]